MKLLLREHLTNYTMFEHNLLKGLKQEFSGNLRFSCIWVGGPVLECRNTITNQYSHISLRYGHINFTNIPEKIIEYVLKLTNCNFYNIRNNDKLMAHHSTMSHNNIWILPEIHHINLRYYVYMNNVYVLLLERDHTLKLMQVYCNIDTVKMVFQLIGEIIECGLRIAGEYKILFNENGQWIPEKENDDTFRPQFLD